MWKFTSKCILTLFVGLNDAETSQAITNCLWSTKANQNRTFNQINIVLPLSSNFFKMKDIGVALLLLFIQSALSALPSCSEIRIRYEWNDLPRGDQLAYVRAIDQLHRSGRYERFSIMHQNNFNAWHGNPGFLPVHRYLLYEFEAALRTINSSVIIPYCTFYYFLNSRELDC
jgi:hypothetical protein